MRFDLRLVDETFPLGAEDPRVPLSRLLVAIGYLKKQRGKSADEVFGTVPFRLFHDHFLGHPDRPFEVRDLAEQLGSARLTVYRHVHRLHGLGLIQAEKVADEDKIYRWQYQLRGGGLAAAWDMVETRAEEALQGYRKAVDHLDLALAPESI